MLNQMPGATVFVEPHPSPYKQAGKPAVLSSGRGGAGNYHSYSQDTLTDGANASGPASAASWLKAKAKAVTPSLPHSSSPVAAEASKETTSPRPTTARKTSGSREPPRVVTGRGGRGNLKPLDERKAYDFEEELVRDRSRSKSVARRAQSRGRSGSIVHVGRGGQGNAVVDDDQGDRAGRRAGSIASATSRSSRGRASMSSQDSDGGWRGRLGRVLSRESN